MQLQLLSSVKKIIKPKIKLLFAFLLIMIFSFMLMWSVTNHYLNKQTHHAAEQYIENLIGSSISSLQYHLLNENDEQAKILLKSLSQQKYITYVELRDKQGQILFSAKQQQTEQSLLTSLQSANHHTKVLTILHDEQVLGYISAMMDIQQFASTVADDQQKILIIFLLLALLAILLFTLLLRKYKVSQI